MADIEHSTIADPNIHEPKGVAAADEFTVYIADGAGSGEWGILTEDSLDFTVSSAFGSNLLHVNYSTNSPADIPTNSTWIQRKLNTVVTNEISASLSSNRITLGAGTYWIDAVVMNTNASTLSTFKSRLYNVTDGETTLSGTIGTTDESTLGQSFIRGRFTIAGSKAFDIMTHQETGSSNLIADSYGSQTSVFHTVCIWKL